MAEHFNLLVDRAVIEIIGCKFHARVVNRDAPEGRKVSGEWALIAALVLVMKYNNQDKLQLVHQPLLIKEWLTVKSDY